MKASSFCGAWLQGSDSWTSTNPASCWGFIKVVPWGKQGRRRAWVPDAFLLRRPPPYLFLCPGSTWDPAFLFQVKGCSLSFCLVPKPTLKEGSPGEPNKSSLIAPLISTFDNASQRQSWGTTGLLLNDAAQAPHRRGHKTINGALSSAILPNRIPPACQTNAVQVMNTYLAKAIDSQVSFPPVSSSSH